MPRAPWMLFAALLLLAPWRLGASFDLPIAGLINPAGEEVATYEYGPYGELLRATGPVKDACNFRWKTRYTDPVTEFVYFGVRYYDPDTGRWLSREPLGELASANLYAYCNGDPVNYVDRLGLEVSSFQVVVGVGGHGPPAPGVMAGTLNGNTPFDALAVLTAPVNLPTVAQDQQVVNSLYANSLGPVAETFLPLAMEMAQRSGVLNWLMDPSQQMTKDEHLQMRRDAEWSEIIFKDYGVLVSGQIEAYTYRQARSDRNWRIFAAFTPADFFQTNFADENPRWWERGLSVLSLAPMAGAVTAPERGALRAAATTSLWKSAVPGIQVRQFGNWWVKRVNPDASPLMQWWGEISINAQYKGLQRLGDMATAHHLRNGLLFTRDVGQTLPDGFRLFNPISRSAYFQGSTRMGTYFNDIQPRNMGMNGLIFDPAIDPFTRSLFYGTAGGIFGWGAYEIYNSK